MSNFSREHAVVVGAGMGGLTAAKALSAHFRRVTVIERDSLSSDAEPRRGTPQAGHAHCLLAGGLAALNRFFPGIDADIERAGAARIQTGTMRLEQPGFDPFPQRDLGYFSYFLSRPLLELITRRRAMSQPNISFLENCRVTGISAAADGASVAGVDFEDAAGRRQSLAADLVVDASGRGALTLGLLDRLGWPKPEATEIGIDKAYATLVFEGPMRSPAARNGVLHIPDAPGCNRGGALFPMENDRWILSIGCGHGDLPPADIEGVMTFVAGFRTSTIHDAILGMKPVRDVARFLLPCSVRRHFERLDRFPDGLIPLGDAVCRFNPVFGQGMSVAVKEAVILDRLLALGRADDRGLARDFFHELPEVLETPWSVAMIDFIYPETRGVRPAGFAEMLQFGAALDQLAAEDPAIHKIQAEVFDLITPQSALSDPAIVGRVSELMSAMASHG